MTEAIGYIAATLAIAGVLLNNSKLIWCFPVWIVSNTLCWMLHYDAGLNSLAWRDVAFTGLAVHGWWKWDKLNRATK